MILSYEQERKLTKGLLLASGLTDEDAEILGTVVTHSDFTGVYSHGLSRFTRYLRQFQNGSLNPHAKLEKVLDDKGVAVYDSDNASGIIALCKVYDDNLKKAKENGIAFATGRHNSNIGCGSYYGWRAAADDMILITAANTYTFASPYGGADRITGTNPIIIAIPTGEEYPMVMDIATTIVAMGKIQAAAREGKNIPLDWGAKDYDGNPTTDSRVAYSLSPIGAHKGYGLAVMVDALSTLLSGACYGTDIGQITKLEPENTGFFMILIDPSKFMPIEEFKANADRYVRMIKGSRKATGVDEIFMPGEIEYRLFKETKKNGINISDAVCTELAGLAAGLGVIPEGADFDALLAHFGG
jgi:LDH2 family malate/lactate/ureidoglycolate dehydrogenase